MSQTDDEWLADVFEDKTCFVCGWSASQHKVMTDRQGERVFWCTDPIPATLSVPESEAELARRQSLAP